MRAGKFMTVLVLTGTALCSGLAAETSGTATVARFGQPLTPELELTPVAAIVSDPDAWDGKRVRVAGQVAGVCAHQGCWIDLVSTDDKTLRVKVDDGVIVFPPEAKGHTAVAEGKVEILDMERDAYESWMRHVADEEGRDFDPAEVGEGPYRVVRLRGFGAEIEGL